MTDPMLGIRDFSCIKGSFPNPSEGSPSQLPDHSQAEINHAPFLDNNDPRLVDPSFLFELIHTSEGDSLEHSAPSTPGR